MCTWIANSPVARWPETVVLLDGEEIATPIGEVDCVTGDGRRGRNIATGLLRFLSSLRWCHERLKTPETTALALYCSAVSMY
jgi:hypothetical protein